MKPLLQMMRTTTKIAHVAVGDVEGVGERNAMLPSESVPNPPMVRWRIAKGKMTTITTTIRIRNWLTVNYHLGPKRLTSSCKRT